MSSQTVSPETTLFVLAKRVDKEYNNYIHSPYDDPPNADYWDSVTDFFFAWRNLSSSIDPVFKAMNLDLAVLKWNEQLLEFDSKDGVDPSPSGDYWNCQKVATDIIIKWKSLYSVSLQPPAIDYLHSMGQDSAAIARVWGLSDISDVRREVLQPGSVIGPDYKCPNEADRLAKRAKIDSWIESDAASIDSDTVPDLPRGTEADGPASDTGEMPKSVEECYATQMSAELASSVTGVPVQDVVSIYKALDGGDTSDSDFDDDSELGKSLQAMSYEQLLVKASEMNIVLRGRKPNVDTLRRKIVEASTNDG